MSDHDDLLVLARRGDLSDADDRRLHELLAASPEARALYEAGRAFDADGSVVAGDDQRIARIERRVQKRLRRSARPRPSWILRTVLAAALITGGAVGAVELTRQASPPARTPEPPATDRVVTPRPVAPASHRVAAVEPPAPEPPVVEVPPPPPPAPPVHAAVVKPPPPPDAAVEPPPGATVTALDLFAAANRARVAGDLEEAIRISRELEDQFPATKEAISTHLSLAMIYLHEQDGNAAYDEFHRYRALATAATMPEAIWGESQALHLLGRVADERAALDELLARYPQSAYSAAAQKRLAGLH